MLIVVCLQIWNYEIWSSWCDTWVKMACWVTYWCPVISMIMMDEVFNSFMLTFFASDMNVTMCWLSHTQTHMYIYYIACCTYLKTRVWYADLLAFQMYEKCDLCILVAMFIVGMLSRLSSRVKMFPCDIAFFSEGWSFCVAFSLRRIS